MVNTVGKDCTQPRRKPRSMSEIKRSSPDIATFRQVALAGIAHRAFDENLGVPGALGGGFGGSFQAQGV